MAVCANNKNSSTTVSLGVKTLVLAYQLKTDLLKLDQAYIVAICVGTQQCSGSLLYLVTSYRSA